ncbi:uncharacterized protein N7459_006237 [Penicillium hispanicum]|uniref:uncharacterized protein n=1 Tax=Penicillium hispanicum TaxID=1080232 RepID=UPI002540DF73|nr:uncharacterized protein N7459_006237 [Penicillium hispanicum]KAJ5580252.1 hypothetical protein N7459_006237 [Penicillium hispanicum]
MSLAAEQLYAIGVAGRVASTLSIVGTITIIAAFLCSRHFRSPIHRIIFFNAFYNLFDSVATMISVSGPAAGDTSSLCQFQGFVLQMFPLADVLWTFAMALDTYLVVFYHFDIHSLHKLEIKYIGVITALTFIPALVFLFIQTAEKGHIYGSETIWCSISHNWMLIRLVLYYGPVWYGPLSRGACFLVDIESNRLIIAVVLLFYCLIGIEIVRLRDEFKLTDDDHIALSSTLSSLNNSHGTVTTTVEANSSTKSSHPSESHIISDSSVEQTVTPRLNTGSHAPIAYKSSQQRQVSFKQYILMPSLFFLALLATWVTPTINRVSAFIRPGNESYSLLLAVSALGSLRGFWNGVIFITIGMKGRKRQGWARRLWR